MAIRYAHPVDCFDETLWTKSILQRRSSEITPLYIHRYRGVRVHSPLTTHNHWEMTCTLAETGVIEAASEINLKRNVVFLVPPAAAHREKSNADLDTIWIGFQAPHLTGAGPSVLSLRDPGLAAFIQKLWLFSRSRGAPIGPELDGLTQTAVGRFFRLLNDERSPQTQDLGDRVVEYFEAHFGESHTVASLARLFGCSEGYLHRSFQHKTGTSPMTYLRRTRLRHAMLHLNNSNRSIAEIAAMVGYNDPFHFSRVFRETTGETPTAYRGKARQA